MKNRLKEFMTQMSLNAADLADKIGVQRSNISHILNGRNLPSSQFIEKLLNSFPELDAGWLITGKGKMLKPVGNARMSEPAGMLYTKPAEVSPPEKTISKTSSLIPDTPKKIEKVVFFYSDRRFAEYYPE